jgi:uncharacterized protein (TIGR02246 family)
MHARIFLPAVLTLLAPAISVAQDAPAPAAAAAVSPEEAAATDTIAAYTAAYNKGDSAALAALFSEDAEWIDADGTATSGRAAIAALLKGLFASSQGRSLAVSLESARRIAPDVLSLRAAATITDADGSTATANYTAVQVKKDGKWEIFQFTEVDSDDAPATPSLLGTLDSLTGSWKAEGDGPANQSTLEWSASGKFITRTFSIAGTDDSEAREGTEIIGWDAEQGHIRSWVFESDGSFSERTWTPDGNRWLILSRTVLPDGTAGSEEITLTIADKDKLTWTATNRSIGDQTLPNLDPLTIKRVIK